MDRQPSISLTTTHRWGWFSSLCSADKSEILGLVSTEWGLSVLCHHRYVVWRCCGGEDTTLWDNIQRYELQTMTALDTFQNINYHCIPKAVLWWSVRFLPSFHNDSKFSKWLIETPPLSSVVKHEGGAQSEREQCWWVLSSSGQNNIEKRFLWLIFILIIRDTDGVPTPPHPSLAAEPLLLYYLLFNTTEILTWYIVKVRWNMFRYNTISNKRWSD